MSRFRLRYQATDLELPDGEFVIGRSSACNLALDDALVSRQHATLRVDGSKVVVEDLGSRNGVLVNDVKIKGTRSLKHLDRVSIGSQEIVLIELGRRRRQAPTGEAVQCHVCGQWVGGADVRCAHCGVVISRAGVTLAGATLEMQLPMEADPDDVTRQATGFELLSSIASKAFALKKFDEAERILEKHLDNMMRNAEQGSPMSPALLSQATGTVLRLAEGLRNARWIDWAFRIHTASSQVMSAETVDRLHTLVRAVGYRDARALRAYLSKLRATHPSLSPAERFVVSRLEGLERVISA